MSMMTSPAWQRLQQIHAGEEITHDMDTSLSELIRAWPGKHGDLHAEARDVLGRVRALHIGVDGSVEVLPYAQDPRLPGLGEDEGVLRVHRYGKRAVVVDETQVYKYLRPGKSEAAAQSWKMISAMCARIGIRIPAIEQINDTRLTFTKAAGETLHDLGNEGLDGWAAFVKLWPALARQDSELPVFCPQQEARTLNMWLSHARTHAILPDSEAISRAADRTTAELLIPSEAVAPRKMVTTHRDLHDKQMLWDGEHLTLLDADTAVRAEAALDIANLRAHIDLRHLQGKIHEQTRVELMRLTEHLAIELQVSPQRLEIYERSSRLRLACVYSFRPRAHQWLSKWVDMTLSAPQS